MMSARKLCKETSKRPSKALFLFPKEGKTGNAPTRLIIEKDLDFTVGQDVHVNWEGKRVPAEILALNGKLYHVVLRLTIYAPVNFNVCKLR